MRGGGGGNIVLSTFIYRLPGKPAFTCIWKRGGGASFKYCSKQYVFMHEKVFVRLFDRLSSIYLLD